MVCVQKSWTWQNWTEGEAPKEEKYCTDIDSPVAPIAIWNLVLYCLDMNALDLELQSNKMRILNQMICGHVTLDCRAKIQLVFVRSALNGI